METGLLDKLIDSYKKAPKEFQATKYWDSKEHAVIQAIRDLSPAELRSGKFPILYTFGFNEFVFNHVNDLGTRIKIMSSLAKRVLANHETYLPYSVDISDIREMAYHHCELLGELTKAKPIHSIETSRFGAPDDLFEIDGKMYSMQFLSYYIRYCFAHKHMSFKGDEIIVELGSGSGHQVEVLKKLYPGMTILCFDLPPQIYLCELYLSNVFGKEQVISAEDTLAWNDLSKLEKGKIHFFGNWQFPLLNNFKFDLFWNAASFGEMEPAVVENYLRFIRENCRWVYLLQLRLGNRASSVEQPIVFEDYSRWLPQHLLVEEHNAYRANKRMTENKGYFEAIWRLKSSGNGQ